MIPLLIVFCKNPELGKVKTRLAKAIGSAKALIIYQKLLEHTAHCVEHTPIKTAIFYSESLVKEDVWNNSADYKEVQSAGDLGMRMAAAFQWGFDRDFGPIVLIGSDLWTLTPRHLQDAFIQLTTHEVVLGPATDGGYYLIGIQQFQGRLFKNMPWSTPELWSKTLDVLKDKTLAILEEQNDIDEESDLRKHPELFQHVNKE